MVVIVIGWDVTPGIVFFFFDKLPVLLAPGIFLAKSSVKVNPLIPMPALLP
jgi:hypothetical protein